MKTQLTSLDITKNIRKEIIEFVGEDFLRLLYKKNIKFSLFTSFKIWLSIFLIFYIASLIDFLSPIQVLIFLLPLSAIMATRINALNVQVHEGSHYLFSRNKKINDKITNWLFGYVIGFDVDAYRLVHLPHHQYLNEKEDPDIELYSYKKNQLIFYFIKDLLGLTALNRLNTYKKYSHKKNKNYASFIGKIITNLLLISFLTISFGVLKGFLLYITLWIIPLLTFFPLIIRMRTISEHSKPTNINFKNYPLFISRTSKCNFLEKYVLGAQMEYHFEHHVFPNIPYKNLKKLHDYLWKNNFFYSHLKSIHPKNAISFGYVKSTKNLIYNS